MSQHLIDTERRYSASHEEEHDAGAHNGGTGSISRHRRNYAGGAYEGRDTVSGSSQEPTGAEEVAAHDATLEALDALGAALEQLAKDHQALEERLVDLRRQRVDGRPWREILSEESSPGTMQIVSRMLACLATASGTLRKELVDSLRREGVSIPAIAKLFGVTHQRVSNLLRRPAE